MNQYLIDNIKNRTIIVYDLEVDRSFDDVKKIFTPEKARLIQIWATKIVNGEIVEVFEDYILPEPWFIISDKVKEITWISDNDIRTWISEKEAIEKFHAFIWDDKFTTMLWGQNHIDYDNVVLWHVTSRIEKDPFLNYELPLENIDIMHIARRMFWRWGNTNEEIWKKMWVNFEEIKEFLTNMTGKDYKNASLHTALYDSTVTSHNLLKLLEKRPELFS